MNNDLYAPYTDPALTAAQTGYETAANTATQYQTASDMLPDALKTAINEKLDYNKGLIEEKNKSMVDYFNAPSQARADYADIFNPFQREALVSKAVNNAYLPFATNQDVLKMRLGSIQDIIGAATGAFNAKVTAKQNAAQIAKDRLAYLFQLAGAKSDAAYKTASLAIEKQKADKTGTGTDGLDFIFKMAGQYKPTAQQETAAINAKSGLASIQRIKEIITKNPQALSNAKNPLTAWGVFDQDARELKKELANVTDILTRARTGAALNADEQKFYSNYIANPLEAILGYQNGTNTSLDNMQSIFTRQISEAKNPYLDALNNYSQATYGVGGMTTGTTTNNDPLGIR